MESFSPGLPLFLPVVMLVLLQAYTTTDAKPFPTVQFYRLKQINVDGSYTYSKVVALSKRTYSNKIINAFPSPARSTICINFTSSNPAKINLQVLNSEGQQVISHELQATIGLNNITLNVSALPNGAYYINCTGISTEPIRFTKVD